MLKILFCCLIPQQPPVNPTLDILPPPKRVAYRPDHVLPFNEDEIKYFRDLYKQNNPDQVIN